MSRASFQVGTTINFVTPGETFILFNPDSSTDVTVTGCNPPLLMDKYVVPKAASSGVPGIARATVCLDAVPGGDYPYTCSHAIVDNPKIIVGS